MLGKFSQWLSCSAWWPLSTSLLRNFEVSELGMFAPFSWSQIQFDQHTLLDQLCQQVTPLGAEDVGPCEAAVTAAHTQVGDAALDQVEGRCQTPFQGVECHAAGAANHSTSLQRAKHSKASITFKYSHWRGSMHISITSRLFIKVFHKTEFVWNANRAFNSILQHRRNSHISPYICKLLTTMKTMHICNTYTDIMDTAQVNMIQPAVSGQQHWMHSTCKITKWQMLFMIPFNSLCQCDIQCEQTGNLFRLKPLSHCSLW